MEDEYYLKCPLAGLKPGTEYVIKIVTLQNTLRSIPLVGKARTRKYSTYPPALVDATTHANSSRAEIIQPSRCWWQARSKVWNRFL